MRHLMRSILVLLFAAGIAHAGAIADLDQNQFQGDGGFGFDIPGEIGQLGIAGGGQLQYDTGTALSTPGDTAGHNPSGQFQNQTDGFNVTGGLDTIDVDWDQTQQSNFDGSTTGGGAYLFGGVNAQLGGAAGANNEQGTAGVAGGAQAGFSAAGVAGVSSDFSGSWQQEQVHNYGMVNQDQSTPNAAVQNQYGSMYSYTGAAVNLNGTGAEVSAAGVIQGGGSVVTNSGSESSAMNGQATAAGEAIAGGQTALAIGFQTHGYYQETNAPDGSAHQSQSGNVFTEVQAIAP